MAFSHLVSSSLAELNCQLQKLFEQLIQASTCSCEDLVTPGHFSPSIDAIQSYGFTVMQHSFHTSNETVRFIDANFI